MAAKRSLLDEIDELVSTWQAETAASSTNSPAISPSPSKKARKTSITPTQAKHDREDDSSSPRARFALMIIEYGIAHIPKDLVEAKTGLSAKQQADMTRRDKGSVYKALKSSTDKM